MIVEVLVKIKVPWSRLIISTLKDPTTEGPCLENFPAGDFLGKVSGLSIRRLSVKKAQELEYGWQTLASTKSVVDSSIQEPHL